MQGGVDLGRGRREGGERGGGAYNTLDQWP